MKRVFVFFGEESQAAAVSLMLREQGAMATVASSVDGIDQGEYDVIFSDLQKFQVHTALRHHPARRLALANRDQGELVQALLGKDMDDVLFSPLDPLQLRLALARPRAFRRREAHSAPTTLVGVTGGLADSWALAKRAAGFDAHVLLTGESGTGKERFAQAIHQLSGRHGRFVAVNCAAIPEGLAESLLFGHVKGAFTGAHATTKGVFSQADGGTLFLDEVGEFSEPIQVKLLRALQTGEVQPLGSDLGTSVDVRVVSATSRDLPERMNQGLFREDLYYRLAVIPIVLPPLRDRRQDIEPLIGHFLNHFAAQHQVGAVQITPAALALLVDAQWPGNVRQLQNAIERLVVLCEGAEIGAELVRQETQSLAVEPRRPSQRGSLKEIMRSLEEEQLRWALASCDGKRGACAKKLGISPRTLLYKLKEYQIR